MTKLEAVRKDYGSDINFLDEGRPIPRFEDNGAIYAVYDEDELEAAAKEDIRELFFDGLSEQALADWVKKWGGLKEFYNECYINDFRIEDSEVFCDMSDEEIIDFLEGEGYFEEITQEMLDLDKIVDFIYEIDGAEGLAHYDGELTYCKGYTIIREE